MLKYYSFEKSYIKGERGKRGRKGDKGEPGLTGPPGKLLLNSLFILLVQKCFKVTKYI